MFFAMVPAAGLASNSLGSSVNYVALVPPSVAGGTGLGSIVLRGPLQIRGSVSSDTGQVFGSFGVGDSGDAGGILG